MNALYAYDLEDKGFISAYLQTPQEARFSVFFPAACNPDQGYLNGTAVPIAASMDEPTWTYRRGSGPWMECLLETGYDLPDQNNLDALVGELRKLGHEPGCAIAEYLTFGAGDDGRDCRHSATSVGHS